MLLCCFSWRPGGLTRNPNIRSRRSDGFLREETCYFLIGQQVCLEVREEAAQPPLVSLLSY